MVSYVTDDRPPYPYALVFKYYSYADCIGSPDIEWRIQPLIAPLYVFCVFARDPDYPSKNVPFYIDCDAGTYTVFNSGENSNCLDTARYYLTSGSLQNFRYKDKCLADGASPVTPHMKVTCAGQFSP
jgi:hypothetical protein